MRLLFLALAAYAVRRIIQENLEPPAVLPSSLKAGRRRQPSKRQKQGPKP